MSSSFVAFFFFLFFFWSVRIQVKYPTFVIHLFFFYYFSFSFYLSICPSFFFTLPRCFSPSTLIYPLFPTAPFLSRLTKSRYRLYRNTSLILFLSFYSHLSIISYCTIPLTAHKVQISSLSKYKSHSVLSFYSHLSIISYCTIPLSTYQGPDIVAIEIQVSFCFSPSTLIYPLFPTAPFLSTYQVQISSLSKYKSHSVSLLLLSFIHYFLLHHSSLDLPSPDIVSIENKSHSVEWYMLS